MPQSFDTLRIGHRYKIINYGEVTIFEVVSIKNRDAYIIKDLNSLETFNLHQLIEYGTGKDYDLYELEKD